MLFDVIFQYRPKNIYLLALFKHFQCCNYETYPFDPLCCPFWAHNGVFVALWTPKLQENVISYIILLSDFINVCLCHTYTIRKMFIIIFRFYRFWGSSRGSAIFGVSVANLTFQILRMYNQINFPSFAKEMKQKALIVQMLQQKR